MARTKKIAKANVNIDLNKGQQINGAMEQKTTVFDYLNNKGYPYNVKTLEEYKLQLEKMNISDLQRHAVEIAHILPNITDRTRLTKKLEDEFLRKLSDYNIKNSQNSFPKSGLTEEQAKNIRNILGSL